MQQGGSRKTPEPKYLHTNFSCSVTCVNEGSQLKIKYEGFLPPDLEKKIPFLSFLHQLLFYTVNKHCTNMAW